MACITTVKANAVYPSAGSGMAVDPAAPEKGTGSRPDQLIEQAKTHFL
jgi:hypothetical protein